MKHNFALPSAWRIGLLATTCTLFLCAIGFLQAGRINGTLCYALDDSFIMMAISKHLAFNGVWGLTPYNFSSTASSPLFTVLLSAFIWLFGDHLWLPLAMNLLAFSGLMIWLAHKAYQWRLKSWQVWFMLMGLVFFAPIPVLIFGSMEHILHIWIALWSLDALAEKTETTKPWQWLVIGALLAGIRFEGLFEGGLMVLYLWHRKNWIKGLSLGFGMMIPVCTLGFVSLSQGWYFLPNSLILKGYTMNVQDTESFLGFLASWLSKAAMNPHAIVAMLVLYLCMQEEKKKNTPDYLWLGISLLSGVLHFVFARYNHVYRYEAYLMAMSWVAFWRWLSHQPYWQNLQNYSLYFRQNSTQALLFILLILSPIYRSAESYAIGTRAMVNIYQQQVQMARFVHQFYNTAAVGALDVGAIAYYTDCRLIDLWGLGDIEIARLKLARRYNSYAITQSVKKRNMAIAIAYGRVTKHPEWNKVANWIIPHNVVCARDTIHFYGLGDAAARQLKQNLVEFQPNLPEGVGVLYD